MLKQAKSVKELSEEQKSGAEIQIRELQKVVDYDTKDYTVEIIVDKYMVGKDTGTNELYVPDYQREFVWDEKRKSKFIESMILGIPIPYIFTASLGGEIGDDLGRLEIIDGSQRIRTLASFLNDEFKLIGLEKLTQANGFKFSNFDISRQRRISRRPVRVIELSEKADEETRRDMFERINTGSEDLNSMEKRKGIFHGDFYLFIRNCANLPLFKKLCPLSDAKLKREEDTEMVLRFFAYEEGYQGFKGNVEAFLNSYMKKHGKIFNEVQMTDMFIKMLKFVEKYFPHGFKKGPNNRSVPRMRFEAIAVGVSLALASGRPLINKDISMWLEDEKFKSLTQDDAGNRPNRLSGRIEFVRDHLIKK